MLDLPYEYRPMISKQCLISWEGYTHNKGYLYNCLYTDSMYTYVYTVLKIYMYITYIYNLCEKRNSPDCKTNGFNIHRGWHSKHVLTTDTYVPSMICTDPPFELSRHHFFMPML